MKHTFAMQIKLALTLEENARLRKENAILRAQMAQIVEDTYERYIKMYEKAKMPELPAHMYLELRNGVEQ